MGYLRNILGLGEVVDTVTGDTSPAADTFAVDETSIDPAVFGLSSYTSPTAPEPRIDRRSAIQVPAVKRCRDLIAGTLGALPIALFNPQKERVNSALFDQPEKHRARSVTMTQLFEDLLFEGIAWWQITEVGWHGYPVKVKRLDPRKITVDEDAGKVYVNGKRVDDSELIRFDSPNDPLLVAAARAIRTSLMLEAATQRYSDGAPPLAWFSPSGDVDPFEDDEEAVDFLNSWKAGRRERSDGYVPYDLKYNVNGFNPEQLQLADARNHAALEIGRHAGVGADALDINVTSRTYFNAEHKRKELLDFTLGGYYVAVEGRLSMGDVTPPGYVSKFVLDAFLRSDTKTRMETYEIGKRVGAYTDDEIRDLEDKPPLEPAQRPAAVTTATQVRALPAPVDEEENAS